jgi:hypothetical protein
MRFPLGIVALLLGAALGRADDDFENQVRPLLVRHCLGCHGPEKQRGGLRLDSKAGWQTGGESGPAIIPGKPEVSPLIQAVTGKDGVARMPPKEKLSGREILALTKWVRDGAVDPRDGGPAKLGGMTADAARKWWSFQPVNRPTVPKGAFTNPVDAFIGAKLAGRKVAPAADKRVLIRRATYDLTGLPPTPEEVDAFLKDTSRNAFAKVVDRLLASPRYGERWGRHWLDVVRYADTAGDTADYPVPTAWRYRNYVIDAFNADKPYDQFLREQLAGDVLADQGPRDAYAERVTATGYLAISRRFGFDSENYHHLTIQDTIDTLGQSVLGLSLGCARCHDHKYDPVSMWDYYALYAIFDSSRYPFPGSEQKQRLTTLAPLVPPAESREKWREWEARTASLSAKVASQRQTVPVSPLHSLHEIDGDFETQAPADGGSNGVLVPPWLYEGKIAVTTAAQSPFKNLYPAGRVGVSVPAGAGEYRIRQAVYPSRKGPSKGQLHVNFDFRITGAPGANGPHRFSLGDPGKAAVVEVHLATDAVSVRSGKDVERVGAVKPGQWNNVQLTIDFQKRVVSGSVGVPGNTSPFPAKPLAAVWAGPMIELTFDSVDGSHSKLPGIELDNIGVRETPIPPVSTDAPTIPRAGKGADPVAIAAQLRALTGIDGDLELQTKDAPPAEPWNPGPNSAVKLSEGSQSPFCNVYEPGRLGLHMPNRGAYDGFGLTLPKIAPDKDGRLYAGFDFRCESQEAGGKGSWRYYLGHGPGSSAAVELFFNGSEFFRRSADARGSVAPLAIGEWYQVRLTLDLKAKKYSGTLESRKSKKQFQGEFATGWDGGIDYSFIDSYGHVGGVRPSLDADNFVVRAEPLPALDAPPVKADTADGGRRARVAELRKQLATLQSATGADQLELTRLITSGPFEMAYGMAEGTPHGARMHLRGEPDRPGEEVRRGTIRVLGGGPLPDGTPGSGRRELANWITRPDNPLTARVMVNRIWQYHFGHGLVKTPNDFGARGLPPTHPELLDHLASEFVRSGWSVKALHRSIMLSQTYQLASADGAALKSNPAQDATDLYASFPRRRLSAEEIRDSVLAVSGELDSSPAREHPFPSPISWGFTQHAPFTAVYDHNKRSVYLMTQRLKRHPFLALFDGADPNATTAERLVTTVPTQALFFLNDPFVHAKAEKWANRLLAARADEPGRIELAWRHAFGRAPGEPERREAAEFLAEYRAGLKAIKADNIETRALAAYLRGLIGSNEFLYVD